MARNTLSNQAPNKSGKKAPSGNNRGVVLALTGLTAAAIIVALIAIISTTGDGEIVAANSGEAPKEAYEEWIQESLGS